MNMKSISLAAAVALASTAAFAQANAAGGSSKAGAPKTNAGDNMNNSATSKPSPKDASTQGAGTVDKKG
jgi:uncharacterized protein YdeI (BOF family)